jgi:hypothetical protein
LLRERRQQVVYRDANDFTATMHESLESILHQCVPEISLFPRQSGQLAKVPDNLAGKIALDHR